MCGLRQEERGLKFARNGFPLGPSQAKDLLSLLGHFASTKRHTVIHNGDSNPKLPSYKKPVSRTMCTGDLTGDKALDVMDLLKLLQARSPFAPHRSQNGCAHSYSLPYHA